MKKLYSNYLKKKNKIVFNELFSLQQFQNKNNEKAVGNNKSPIGSIQILAILGVIGLVIIIGAVGI